MITVCLWVCVVAARAQSHEPTIDTVFTYRIGDYRVLPYKLNSTYELDRITINGLSAKTIDKTDPHIRIEPTNESFEYFDGVKLIAPGDKKTIIEYLINLIADLMEPGETITIKKQKL